MSVLRGPAENVRILVLESDPAAKRVLLSGLETAAGVEATVVADTLAGARRLARAEDFDLAVVDLDAIGGADSLGALVPLLPDAVVFAVTASGSVSGAIESLRAGAHDFIVKPLSATALIERFAACSRRRHQAVIDTRATAGRPSPVANDFAGFVGSSPLMLGLYDQVRRIAASRAPVFITGESGTGKELCAEAIHAHSGRADAPFIAINCSAIPRELMESEIFGHVRGAFTGASEDRAGAAELADGGTLFLDEIGEMDLALQAKLLRFIQTGVVRRLGDSRSRLVDVRFVAATNRTILDEVSAGRFREDLYYRLHVLPVHVPPLRARVDDILSLAHHFLARFSAEEGRSFTGFSSEVEHRLVTYAWPGNVRQLENVIRRAVVLYDGETIEAAMLAGALPAAPDQPIFLGEQGGYLSAPGFSRHSAAAIAPFWQQERDIIEQALAAFDGNISRAAAALEIAPSTIYRKRQSWTERSHQP
ncbi:MAG: sigma-54-dependent Fis family transcriptional regulator [Hyphomicrobiales bacterium]|nr:MAG: sigma-54-dependent Fis family transcriptional regulator [Hyphomicrobiales bacterium]